MAVDKDSAHEYVGRKVRLSSKWREAPGRRFSDHREETGIVLAARALSHRVVGGGGRVWALTVEWPNGDTDELTLTHLELLEDGKQPENAAFLLFEGKALSSAQLDREIKAIVAWPSHCDCAPGFGAIPIATFIVRCDACARVMLATSVGELIRRQLRAQNGGAL